MCILARNKYTTALPDRSVSSASCVITTTRRKLCYRMSCSPNYRKRWEWTYSPWRKSITCLHYSNLDYCSNFWEVPALPDTRNKSLQTHLMRYGIPDEVFTDNDPQFALEEFKEFICKWKFDHQTLSPAYPQCNDKVVESAVKTPKETYTRPFLLMSDMLLAYNGKCHAAIIWCYVTHYMIGVTETVPINVTHTYYIYS